VLEEGLYAFHWTGSAWAGPYALAGSTPAAAGVASWYDAEAGRLQALYSSGGRLWQATLDGTTSPPVWGPPRVVAPGGDQPASSVASFALPALAPVGDLGLAATWLEAYAGDPAGWRAPITALARGPAYAHWGQCTPLASAATSSQRWPLAYDALEQTLYVGNRRAVLAAPVYDPAVRSWMRLGPLDALAWRWSGSDGAGRLALELLDPDGALRAPGQEGSAARAVQPLASVTLQRGYRTAAGEETIESASWAITSAAYTEGLGGGHLLIEAVDPLGLLALWHPPESLVWWNRSVLWLLEEICARVGLRVTREGTQPAGVDRILSEFALHPHQSALVAVQALLRLGAAVARPGAEQTLALLPLSDGSGSLPTLGVAGEIRQASCGPALPAATHVRVASAAAGIYAEQEWLQGSRRLGTRLSQTLVDNRVGNATHAAALAAHVLALAALEARTDQVTLGLRPELELWDAIELSLPGAAGPRIITAIEEHVNVPGNRFETRLRLGAAE